MSGRPPAQGSFGLDGRLSAEAQARPSSTMGVLLAVLAIAGVASAQSTETSTTAWPIAVPPWLFNQDSRVPAAMQVVSSSRLAFAAAGGEGWAVGRLALSPGGAAEAGDEAVGASGSRLGMRLSPVAWRSTRLVVSGGLVQQLTRTGGAWATFALEQSIGTQQADDDLAVGLLVQAVSESPYAADTLIIVTEDDCQDGPDHVDSHRATAYVVGPYVKKGKVVSTRYTQVSVLRTIEDVLGTPHINLNTAFRRPMSQVFDIESSGDWTYSSTAST